MTDRRSTRHGQLLLPVALLFGNFTMHTMGHRTGHARHEISAGMSAVPPCTRPY
ncbi:hypothetical protein [Streptomyces sannanensis]